MFRFWRNRNKQNIKSVSDFLDSRARTLATAHNLSPEEIFPLYRDLEAELLANNGQIEIDPNVSPDKTIKKIVCGAVINYELSSREILKLEDDGKTAVIKRAVQPNVYESLGRYYEGIAKRLMSQK